MACTNTINFHVFYPKQNVVKTLIFYLLSVNSELMKNITAIVNLPKKSVNNSTESFKRKIVKHTVSINNTQYNMSIEYYPKGETVKEFSIGFALKEMHVNDDKKNRLKTSSKDTSAFSIFFNFINYGKFDLLSLDDDKKKKVSFYKTYKDYFYGYSKSDTSKTFLRASKVSELLLLLLNLYQQITDNENLIETFKNNIKRFPHDKEIMDAKKAALEEKSMLKSQFIDIVKNTLKRYY